MVSRSRSNRGTSRDGGTGIVVGHLAHGLHGRFALEGRASGEHLVEDRAQRVDVGCRADMLGAAPRLLGGHVARRSHDQTGFRRRARDSSRLARPKSLILGIPLAVNRILVGLRSR